MLIWDCLLVFGLGVDGAALAQRLDRLTACNEMARLREAADIDQTICREPRGVLAREMASRSSWQLCFFDPPDSMLGSFECVQTRGYPSVDCYRPVSGNVVRSIKSNFEDGYDRAIAAYLAAASRCPYSNGRASPAPASLMTVSPLAWIARSELAFGAETGPPAKSDGVVIHGFALLDPELPGGAGSIEYVRAYSSRCRGPNCLEFAPGTTDGTEISRADGLALLREADDPALEAMNRQALRAGVPIRWYVASLRVTVATTSLQSLADLRSAARGSGAAEAGRTRAVANLARQMTERLQANAYQTIDAAQIAGLGGGSEDPGASVRRRVPYASRHLLGDFRATAFYKDSGSGCFRRGGMVVVIAIVGDTVSALVAGVDGCRYRARSELDSLTEDLALSAQ